MKPSHLQRYQANPTAVIPEFNVAHANFLAAEKKHLKDKDLIWIAEHRLGSFFSIEKPIPHLKRPYLSPWRELLWLVKHDEMRIGTICAQVTLGIFAKINIMLDFPPASEPYLKAVTFEEFLRLFLSAIFLGVEAEVAKVFFIQKTIFSSLEKYGAYTQPPTWVIKPAYELFGEPMIKLLGYEIAAEVWWNHNDKNSDSEKLKYILGKRQIILDKYGKKPVKVAKKSILKTLWAWGR